MMKSKIVKLILSVGLVSILSFIPASLPLLAVRNTVSGSVAKAGTNAKIKSKDEVIYATLASDGSVHTIYAVNGFTIAEPGNIMDYGDYTSVTNLTDMIPVTQKGDAFTVYANAGNFYYRGDMAVTDLPWIFEILYSLDGVKIAPKELAGKSGELEIHILTRQNGAINPIFHENYMLQISVTLDTEKCRDIKALGATVANAGKNKVMAYTVMPGQDANISLNTTVQDFTMAGIDISAMPFSMDIDLPDTDSMVSDFTQLSDAIFELNDGVGDLSHGVADLKKGAGELTNGSSDIKTGLTKLNSNSGQLIQASSQISGALTNIASSLNGPFQEMDLGDLTQLSQGLSQLGSGLDKISDGLIELKNGFVSAYEALDGAMQGIPDLRISEKQAEELYGKTDPSQHNLLNQLMASYTAGQMAKGTYNQVKGAFDAVGSTVDRLSASIDTISATLDAISKEISDMLSSMDMMEQIEQLSAGILELDNNYTSFHKVLKDYMKGVDKISSGYIDFDKGLSSFGNGIDGLYDGVVQLHDGTTKLKSETAQMPDTMQSEINDMLDQYTGSDFKPISFTSSKNQHTDLVQFVLKCEGIKKPEETKETEVESPKGTFWDRLIALFTRKK